MNVLFITYGDLRSNSLNHISTFAEGLARLGHTCRIALPDHVNREAAPDRSPLAFVYHASLASPQADGFAPDIIHAWTPRTKVMEATLSCFRHLRTPARLLVHMEDNERHLLAHTAGVDFATACKWSERRLSRFMRKGLAHPLRHQLFLAIADCVTGITPTLECLIPSGVAFRHLPPGIDLGAFKPCSQPSESRSSLGLAESERIIVYPGGVNATNAEELHSLYKAVALLNQTGIPTRLLRTGPPATWFNAQLSELEKAVELDLGFVSRDRLPGLLTLADVLVQPGQKGPFNDYRLPSKLPEFLASGRPVLLPPTNIAKTMSDGREALFLHTGTPEDIANGCRRIFSDPTLAQALGRAGRLFAEKHFDQTTNTARLEEVYLSTLAQPVCKKSDLLKSKHKDESDLFLSSEISGKNPELAALVRNRRRKPWIRFLLGP